MHGFDNVLPAYGAVLFYSGRGNVIGNRVTYRRRGDDAGGGDSDGLDIFLSRGACPIH